MRVQGTKPSTWIAASLIMGLLFIASVYSVNPPRSSRRFESSEKMRKIAVAMLRYHNAHQQFPQPASRDTHGRPLLSWRVHVLPFLGEQDLYNEFHLDEPWDSEHNKSLIARMPAVFRNPAHGDLGEKTLYVMPTGPGTVFQSDRPVTIKGITDGPSNTIILVEADPDQAVIWTSPEDLAIDAANPSKGLGHVYKSELFLVAFVDAHTRSLESSTIDPKLLNALFTSQGGEDVSAIDKLR